MLHAILIINISPQLAHQMDKSLPGSYLDTYQDRGVIGSGDCFLNEQESSYFPTFK